MTAEEIRGIKPGRALDDVDRVTFQIWRELTAQLAETKELLERIASAVEGIERR